MNVPGIFIGGYRIKEEVSKYSQEISAIGGGGFYRATFDVTGDREYLNAAFDGWRGKKMRAISNSVAFEGYVYEMTLQDGFESLSIDMNNVYNRVKVFYRNAWDSTTDETPWVEDPASIAEFGVIEHIERVPGAWVGERAADHAAFLISLFSTPEEYGNDLLTTDDLKLSVTVMGAAYHANRSYVEIPPPPDYELDPDAERLEVVVTDRVKELVAAHPFLQIGEIPDAAYTIPLEESNATARFVPFWEHIKQLAARNSREFSPVLATVYEYNRVNFKAASPVPIYKSKGGKRTRMNNDALDYSDRPGVMRRFTGGGLSPAPNSWLASKNDSWQDTVIAQQADEDARLIGKSFDGAAISAAWRGDLYYGG